MCHEWLLAIRGPMAGLDPERSFDLASPGAKNDHLPGFSLNNLVGTGGLIEQVSATKNLEGRSVYKRLRSFDSGAYVQNRHPGHTMDTCGKEILNQGSRAVSSARLTVKSRCSASRNSVTVS